MNGVFGQRGFDVRLDWGPVGAESTRAEICVVVDVLSFSTSVTVAVERGMRVYPYRWQGPGAEAFAGWSYDNSLRPALEDQLGAGAILWRLVSEGYGERLSPEAAAAAELFAVVRPRLTELLHECVSGRELAGKGFRADVDAAAALDVSPIVPALRDGAFTHR